MDREQAVRYLRDEGYRIEHLQGNVWKIWQGNEIVGRGAGDDMLIVFVELLKLQRSPEWQAVNSKGGK